MTQKSSVIKTEFLKPKGLEKYLLCMDRSKGKKLFKEKLR